MGTPMIDYISVTLREDKEPLVVSAPIRTHKLNEQQEPYFEEGENRVITVSALGDGKVRDYSGEFFIPYDYVNIPNPKTMFVLPYEDAVLVGPNNEFLLIRYNADVTQFRKNVVDVITPTLGGEYPYVRRNGNQEYHSFNISGMIISEYEHEEFADSFILELENINYFKNYNEDSESDVLIARQRWHREKVLDFLYTPNIKLFKSGPEGNKLVYLSNIQLTPEKTSRRHVYSFSCTATEIAKATMENCWKCGIGGKIEQ